MRKLLVVFFSISLMFLVAIGSVFTIELTYRLFFKPIRSNQVDVSLFRYAPYLVHKHPSHLNKKNYLFEKIFGGRLETETESESEDKGLTFHTNSLGFRSPEFMDLPPKASNEIRIVITGGSAAISWGVDEDNTLDSFLLQKLQDIYPEKTVKIFNLGNGAWKSFQELIAVQLYGIDIEPDIVVAYNGFNDIQHANHMSINQAYGEYIMNRAFERYEKWVNGNVIELLMQFKSPIAIYKLISGNPIALTGQSPSNQSTKYPMYATNPGIGKLSTHAELPFKHENIQRRTDFDPYLDQVVSAYVRNMFMMYNQLRISKAKLIVVLQPSLYHKDSHSESEITALNSHYMHEANYIIAAYARAAQNFYELSENNEYLYFLNLSNPFEGYKDTVFSDNCHINAEGYRMVSDVLAPVIAEIVY